MKKILLSLLFISGTISSGDAAAQILVEAFRNINCGNCRVPDDQLEAYVKANPGRNIKILYYHDGITLPSDLFYVASKADVDARISFYAIIPNPWAHVNGWNASSSFSSWRQTIEEQPPTPPVAVSGSAKVTGKTIDVTFTATGTNAKTLIPFAMVIESNIFYDNTWSYGKMENNLWHNVFRAAIPGKDGGEEFTLSGSKEFHYTFDASAKDWNFSNLEVIVFVQEKEASSGTDHPIVGWATLPVESGSVRTFPAGDLAGFELLTPNPFTERIQIPFTLREPAHVTIRISDLLGREVATVLNQKVSELRSSVTFEPQGLVAGTYVASIYVNGSLAGTEKLVYNP